MANAKRMRTKAMHAMQQPLLISALRMENLHSASIPLSGIQHVAVISQFAITMPAWLAIPQRRKNPVLLREKSVNALQLESLPSSIAMQTKSATRAAAPNAIRQLHLFAPMVHRSRHAIPPANMKTRPVPMGSNARMTLAQMTAPRTKTAKPITTSAIQENVNSSRNAQ